jgi:hypothetical protein
MVNPVFKYASDSLARLTNQLFTVESEHLLLS